jgi:CO/xanthine dehydrogenase Mo-binding subunit
VAYIGIKSRIAQYGSPVSSYLPHWENGIRRTDADLQSCCRALGTPLDWPEAQKKADQVRKWGIQVRISRPVEYMILMAIGSNYWRFGTGPRARRRMLCCGVMRLVHSTSLGYVSEGLADRIPGRQLQSGRPQCYAFAPSSRYLTCTGS